MEDACFSIIEQMIFVFEHCIQRQIEGIHIDRTFAWNPLPLVEEVLRLATL